MKLNELALILYSKRSRVGATPPDYYTRGYLFRYSRGEQLIILRKSREK